MSGPVITLRNITKIFRVNEPGENTGAEQIQDGKFYALDNVSLEVKKNTATLIAGANGSGKTLLMSIIARLEEPTSGELDVVGRVGLIFQDADSQILGETPREDVAIGVKNSILKKAEQSGEFKKLRHAKTEIDGIVNSALERVGLIEKADFPARFFSGGEKRRLAVAGVLAMDADIIIFDEPYANLDYTGIVQVNTMLVELIEKNKTIIILTHELEKCLAFAHNFIVLHQGKMVFNGCPEEGLKQDLQKYALRNPLLHTGGFKDLFWQ
jgi:biotin transport system ATP-binding protein